MVSAGKMQRALTDFDYKMGQYFSAQNLFGPTRYAQNKFIHQVAPVADFDFSMLKDDAGAMYGISGIRLDLPSGENELLTFISKIS
ncbi:MAG: hypothetical protein IPJ13_15720 [Saprospiraceae bacterium]|nr:hypothetical protein [Saprospiraceae bacterium]